MLFRDRSSTQSTAGPNAQGEQHQEVLLGKADECCTKPNVDEKGEMTRGKHRGVNISTATQSLDGQRQV